MKAPLSVLIPTKNEERNIGECITSVVWADEIIVLDSLSSDKTVGIVEKMGVTVIQREFDDFSTHKNWALDHIDFQHEWILIVDADERSTELLAQEIRQILQHPSEINGYYLARQNWFAGKWIRHGGWYPNWNLRLFRLGKARYETRIVHEHMLLDGPVDYLKNPLIHYDYKGIERYFDRHNLYSSLEAVEVYRLFNSQEQRKFLLPTLWTRGPERRRFLKHLAYRYLPARPVFKFLWMYLLQLGFLDGRIGLRYCLLHMFYEFQIDLKLEELRDSDSPLSHRYNLYLSKINLSETYGKCVLCGHDISTSDRTIFDTRFGIETLYGTATCTQCDMEQTLPTISSAKELKRLYEQYYNFSGEKNTLYTRIRKWFLSSPFYRFWQAIDGDITFYTPQGSGRLLDIGCNEGRGLRFFRLNGFEAEGWEINEVAAKIAQEQNFVVHMEPLEQFHPSEPYDVVVLTNVLEHVLDPQSVLSHVYHFLKPGGTVWISCPNNRSWLRSVFGKFWINWHVPFHIVHFSSSTLQHLLEEAGFTITESRQETPALWVTLSCISRLFAKMGQPTRQLRSPFLVAFLILMIRGLGFPLLWLGNQLGKGDCLVIHAKR